MRKIISTVVLAVTLFAVITGAFAAAPLKANAKTTEKLSVSRLINVVYDDSNSMLDDQRLWWCYAKYSLEIFSALMQEKDRMDVFFMSDYKTSGKTTPTLSLNGTQSNKQMNVEKIHKNVTRTSGTPFSAIRVAFDSLKRDNGAFTEKWLIVITDGDKFDGNEGKADLDSICRDATANGIKVVYLAIGSDLTPTSRENDGVFVKKAKGDDAKGEAGILSRVTEISQIIFQRPTIMKPDASKITFTLPVSEIIVLAQGKNVKIGDISGMGKYEVSVNMMPSDRDKASNNYDYINSELKGIGNINIEELHGTVAIFTPSNGLYINEGEYDFSVTADKYDIYYKPCLDLVLNIKDVNGNNMTDYYIPKGSYDIERYLTYPEGHAKHGEHVNESLLNTTYEVVCSENGSSRVLNSNHIDLGTGNVEITAEAKYLNFISQDISSKFVVEDFTVDKLELTLDYLQRDYYLSKLESENEGVLVTVTKGGSKIPAEDWERFVITAEAERLDFKTVKNSDSSFTVHPQYNNGDKKNTATGDNVPFKVTVSASNDHRKTDEGSAAGAINIIDDVTAADLNIVIDPQKEEYDNATIGDAEPYRTFSITWRGMNLTKEQYDSLEATVSDKNDCFDSTVALDPYKEGSPVTGVVKFSVIRDENGELPEMSRLKDVDFEVSATMEREGEISSGRAEDTLKVKDVRSFWEKLIAFLKANWWWLAILLYLLTLFKRTLPKRIEAKVIGQRAPAVIEPYKNVLTVLSFLIPFRPIHSTLKFDNNNFKNRFAFDMRVKAAKKGFAKCTMKTRRNMHASKMTIDGEDNAVLVDLKGSTIQKGNSKLIQFM